jgi:type II secretory pathway pseudopilin PulG
MINQNRYSKKEEKRGFTLIETLVATLVIMFAITGPLTLAFRSISYTKVARDQTIATYLAHDALEYVIAKKIYNLNDEDNEWLDGVTENTNCDESENCMVDTLANVDTGNLVECTNDCQLYYNESDNVFTHNSGDTETPFKRSIKIEEVVDIDGDVTEDEAKVSVTMTWNSGIIPKTFTLSTYIYNHQVD